MYSGFHRYGIIKTPNKITFTIDGKPYASRSKKSNSPLDWPYNQPYYLILNLAIGGKWAGANGIDNASAPWLMQVKSISYRPL
jgi:beta-glucanase (GH16 family)